MLRKNNLVCDLDRRRIVQAYIDGKEYLEVARTLNVKPDTARKIVKIYNETGRSERLKQGGRRESCTKVTGEIMDFMKKLLDENCQITLKEITSSVETRFHVRVSVSTVARHLDGAMYTIKKVIQQPVDRNSPAVLQARAAYANAFLSEVPGRSYPVFIDEMGFNLWTKRSYGRALKGTDAVRVVNGQKGRNITVLMAVGMQGVIKHKFCSSVKKEDFFIFIDEVIDLLRDEPLLPTVVFDNAPSHRGIEDHLADAVTANPHLLRRLPPWSPMLNIIEEVFSSYKAAIKRELASRSRELYDNSIPAARHMTLTAYRREILEEVATNALSTITPENVMRYYNHMLTILPNCIAKVPL